MDNKTSSELLSNALVDAIEVVLVQIEPDMLFDLIVDLGSVMAHVGQKLINNKQIRKSSGTYIETSQVWDVIERNLLNAESEASFSSEITEWTVGSPLSVLNFQLALVALLFELKALLERHRVVVLELGVLRKFERVKTVLLSESGHAKSLNFKERGRFDEGLPRSCG